MMTSKKKGCVPSCTKYTTLAACAIKMCRHHKGLQNATEHVTYYRLPTDPAMLADWTKMIGASRGEARWRPTASSCICAEHFTENDFKVTGSRVDLKEAAVPSRAMFLSPEKLTNGNSSDPRNSLREPDYVAPATDASTHYQMDICRVCLSVESVVPLRELSVDLAQYYRDICCDISEISKYMCCAQCDESLRGHLDFRSKCLKSNEMLHNWKTDIDKDKIPMESLHKTLIKYLNQGNTQKCKINNLYINKNVNNLNNTNGMYSIESIKDEEIKTESVTADVKTNDFEFNEDLSDDVLLIDVKRNMNRKTEMRDFEKVKSDTEHDIKKIKVPKTLKRPNGKVRDTKRNEKDFTLSKREIGKGKGRVYQRKAASAYAQYEPVFHMQLFKTDEEARHEFGLRRTSEPYVSAQHRCEVCYTVYKCERLLQFHMKWHKASPHECDICHMTFTSTKAHQTHKSKCHRGKFSCKLCPLVTYYGAAMKAHFQKHQGKTYTCHCGRTYNHISTYLSHKRTVHAAASEHVCVHCARTFVSAQGLLNHVRRAHQGVTADSDSPVTVVCAPCGLTFASQLVYNVHLLNTDVHRDVASTLIACSTCGLPFDERNQLRAHKRQNHPKKKGTNDIIHCKICGAGGPGRVWRRRHYQSEHPSADYSDVGEAKRHLCENCGRQFANATILKDHMNTHSGAKPYVCAECGARYHAQARLSLHREQHKPPARACVHCKTTFRSASNLAVHMRIHTGVKRHACSVCGKAFLHRGSAREHERSVHRHIRRVRRKHDTVTD